MKIELNINKQIDEIYKIIMDDILAQLGDETAEMIMRGIKPHDDWGKGVFWAVKRVNEALYNLKKD